MNKEEAANYFFERIYNANDSNEAQKIIDEIVAPDFVDYSPVFGASPDKKGMRETVGFINRVFEQNYKVQRLIVEGDTYAGIWKAKVKHIGEFMSVPPTQKEFEVNGITVYQIVDNKIKAHWEQFEVVKILQNLGVVSL